MVLGGGGVRKLNQGPCSLLEPCLHLEGHREPVDGTRQGRGATGFILYRRETPVFPGALRLEKGMRGSCGYLKRGSSGPGWGAMGAGEKDGNKIEAEVKPPSSRYTGLPCSGAMAGWVLLKQG